MVDACLKALNADVYPTYMYVYPEYTSTLRLLRVHKVEHLQNVFEPSITFFVIKFFE